MEKDDVAGLAYRLLTTWSTTAEQAAAAAALIAQAAEIERLHLKDAYNGKLHRRSIDLLDEAMAEIEALRKQVVACRDTLGWYADQMCEGWCMSNGGEFEDCAGCPALAALAALPAELAGMVLIERDALAAAIPYIYEIRDDAGSKAAEKVRRRLIAAQEGK